MSSSNSSRLIESLRLLPAHWAKTLAWGFLESDFLASSTLITRSW